MAREREDCQGAGKTDSRGMFLKDAVLKSTCTDHKERIKSDKIRRLDYNRRMTNGQKSNV